jgi:hypothetical protein
VGTPEDYRKYYGQNLESYLFEDVATRYRQNGVLDAFDFFCIIIWKANRAKSKVAPRLLACGFDDLDDAVRALTKSIARADGPQSRMEDLLKDWGFRLPMASAILTVLYPDDFTVYDVRVCQQLQGFFGIDNVADFGEQWNKYEEYVQRVRQQPNAPGSLRENDKWLWGKSFEEQLRRDIRARFEKKDKEK